MPTIAIQGQIASFHDVAAHQFFGEDIELMCCETFADVFAALDSGAADLAMVAVENSLHGTINPVYDLLLRYRPWIFGETYLRIHQCLIGMPDAALSDIREVHSHTAALSQCAEYLDHNLHSAARYENVDTAGAVRDLVKWNDPHKAAIASEAAAELYGMQVLARDIETNPHNYTRFVALAREPRPTRPPHKTSIVFRTAHSTGALYHALGAFDAEGINLTLVTSRPIVGEHQKYLFYLDFEAGQEEPRTQRALDVLATQGCEVTILGSYQTAKLPE